MHSAITRSLFVVRYFAAPLERAAAGAHLFSPGRDVGGAGRRAYASERRAAASGEYFATCTTIVDELMPQARAISGYE